MTGVTVTGNNHAGNRKGPDDAEEPMETVGGLPAEVWATGEGRGKEGAPGEFRVSDRVYRVMGVSDWWPGREFEHFRVRTGCGAIYLLHHHLPSGRWLAQWLQNTDA